MNKEKEKIKKTEKEEKQPYTNYVIVNLFVLLINFINVLIWLNLYLQGHEYGLIWIFVSGLIIIYQIIKLYKYGKQDIFKFPIIKF